MPKPNRTRQALLGFLARRPRSGYDIRRAIDASTSNFWQESYGQIYPMLRRLEEEGLATRTTKAGRGGRTRHVYAITEDGRQELHRWLEEPTDPEVVRHELLLKLFFGREVGPDVCIRQLEAYGAREREFIEKYEAIAADLEATAADDPELPYWLMTLRFGLSRRRAALDWCEQTLAELRTMAAGATPATKRAG